MSQETETLSDGEKSNRQSPVIQSESVVLGYGRHVVLNEADLQIHQGEFWCFLGSNGQGKTTYIKALLGAIRPLQGKIFFRKDFARRTRIGFVPQECELNTAAPITVREFILTGLVGLAVDTKNRNKRLRRLLDLLDLQKHHNKNVWELSGGQRQRAMVARALVRDPLVLIVDEPTAGLDLSAAQSVLNTMTNLSKEHGITIVFVTHDLEIAAQRASHVALFRNGAVTGGPLETHFTSKMLTETFGVPVQVDKGPDGIRSVSYEKTSSNSSENNQERATS